MAPDQSEIYSPQIVHLKLNFSHDLSHDIISFLNETVRQFLLQYIAQIVVCSRLALSRIRLDIETLFYGYYLCRAKSRKGAFLHEHQLVIILCARGRFEQ